MVDLVVTSGGSDSGVEVVFNKEVVEGLVLCECE